MTHYLGWLGRDCQVTPCHTMSPKQGNCANYVVIVQRGQIEAKSRPRSPKASQFYTVGRFQGVGHDSSILRGIGQFSCNWPRHPGWPMSHPSCFESGPCSLQRCRFHPNRAINWFQETLEVLLWLSLITIYVKTSNKNSDTLLGPTVPAQHADLPLQSLRCKPWIEWVSCYMQLPLQWSSSTARWSTCLLTETIHGPLVPTPVHQTELPV